MEKILFVCTGNTCRSPMAEGFFNHLAQKLGLNAEAASCGISGGGSRASGYAVEVMSGYGVDISRHLPQSITPELIEKADMIYCLTSRHEDVLKRAFPESSDKITTISENDIADPFMGSLSDYEAAALEIKEAVEKIAGDARWK